MDNMTPQQRSQTMSKIRSHNTSPEQRIRSALHRCGYRFRKNLTNLPGTPDIVLKKFKTVIFVNGCFWHQHAGCPKASMPKSNEDYWQKKFHKTIVRDAKNIKKLQELGWRVIVVWECEIDENLEKTASKIKKILSKQII